MIDVRDGTTRLLCVGEMMRLSGNLGGSVQRVHT